MKLLKSFRGRKCVLEGQEAEDALTLLTRLFATTRQEMLHRLALGQGVYTKQGTYYLHREKQR